MRESELELLREKLLYLARGADVVVFAGTLPRGVAEDFYAEAIRELNRRGVRTVLDTEGEPLRLGVEAEPYLVSPNQAEAESLVGQEFTEEQDFVQALDHIAELGARNVLITEETGCFALLREERADSQAVPGHGADGRGALGRGRGRRAAGRLPRGAVRGAHRRGGAARGGGRGRGLDARDRRRPVRAA